MWQDVINTIISIVVTVLASSGFWAFLQVRKDKHDSKTLLLKGLAEDRINYLGMHYIDRGYMSQEEYHNLYERLYTPYKNSGWNGSAQKTMQDVEKLPMYKPVYLNPNEKEKEHDSVE